MINCIVIVMDGIGDFDHDSRILSERIEDLEHEEKLADVPVLRYSYSNDQLFQVQSGIIREIASIISIAGISPPVTTKSPMENSSVTISSITRSSMPS